MKPEIEAQFSKAASDVMADDLDYFNSIDSVVAKNVDKLTPVELAKATLLSGTAKGFLKHVGGINVRNVEDALLSLVNESRNPSKK